MKSLFIKLRPALSAAAGAPLLRFETRWRDALGMAQAMRDLASSGILAIAIRLSGAGLNFLMFIVAAKVTDAHEFGLFSVAFAAASLVSFINVVGQQSLVLRFWPQYAGDGDLASARAALHYSTRIVLAGLVVGAAVLAMAGLWPQGTGGMSQWTSLCLGAALLSVALGWAEFLSSVLRARNEILGALLPRDVAWRLAVMGGLAVAWQANGPLSAVAVTFWSGLLLLACLLPQTIRLALDLFKGERSVLTPAQRSELKNVTLGLWGVNALPPAFAQINTLLIAAILGPFFAGAVFAAERSARLIELPLNGLNQVLAPYISRNFHNKGPESVQAALGITAVISFVLAVSVTAGFAIFGKTVLALFDDAYATREIWAVLMIFAASSTFAAACGPTALYLQLTGHQHALLSVFVRAGVFGLAAVAVGALWYGPVGAAFGIALTMAIANIIPAARARRTGADPTILSAARLLGKSHGSASSAKRATGQN